MNDETLQNFDTLIVEQIESKARWQKTMLEIESRIAMGQGTAKDKVDLATAKSRIKTADDAIADYTKQRKEYQTVDKSEKQQESYQEECKVVEELIKKHNIGYLTAENHYIYCIGMQKEGSDLINPVFKQVHSTNFGRVLNKMARKQLRLGTKTFAPDLADYFQESKNDYYDTTASFQSLKWSDEKVYNKASVIRKFWVQPDFANKDSYDKRFDFLTHCVGGGKQENMDHLEQWVGYKWCHPERVGNTPNLDIGGYPGGNGKGREIELCKTIFTAPCVIAAALKELMDGFNGTWELATLLYYDEPAANELPEGKLKQATGGEDMRSEKKGIDATMVDRNYSILFVSNNPNGVVKLSGTGAGGEDRRYSVMITAKVMIDEAINLGLAKDLDEAKVFVNGINILIKQRSEVAKWLAFIIDKHDVQNMPHLNALHGQDYWERFESQKNDVDNAFDLILPVYKQNNCIPNKILHQLVIAITGKEKLAAKGVTQKWERYLTKNKVPHVVTKERVKHMFKDEVAFEGTSGVAVTLMSENTQAVFDHATISNKIPTKNTVYDSTNIILGQEFNSDDHPNVVELKNASMSVMDRLRAKLNEEKNK